MNIKLTVKGAAPNARDPHEAVAVLHGIPRVGDTLNIWDGRSEVYVKVGMVTWPTWQYAHDDDTTPELWLDRPEEMGDEEWAEVFTTIALRPAP
jgi:hypothetical protein